MNKQYRTIAQVDLAAIRHNGEVIRKTFPDKKILSVLKADAYGHGIKGVLPAYETFSDWYAVATVEEGLVIRENSEKPILLFGPVPENKMVLAAKNKLTFTVGDLQYAKKLQEAFDKSNLIADVQLKIDTGLNRSGVRWRNGEADIKQIIDIVNLRNLHLVGTYTHFACGEGTETFEKEFTGLQFERFQAACSAMESAGISVGLRHCCSTGGAIMHPDYQMDMVRLGMMPLGMSFSEESMEQLKLQPALSWTSYVSQIKHIEPGDAVSYGCTFIANKPMKIGLITCGYADGYRRTYSNKSHVLVGNKKVPVLGRIAMDYLMIDLTDVDNAQCGMPVVLLGENAYHRITALELSQYGESVCGEVTCAISERVPRIYIN